MAGLSIARSNMKKYLVYFHYDECGKTIVKAKTAKEAEAKLYKHFENKGLDDLVYSCTDRDYNTTESEEI